MKQEERLHNIMIFRRVLNGPQGDAVKAILRDLCKAELPNYAADPHNMAYLGGRKDVWHDIERMERIPIETLEKSIAERKQQDAGSVLD